MKEGKSKKGERIRQGQQQAQSAKVQSGPGLACSRVRVDKGEIDMGKEEVREEAGNMCMCVCVGGGIRNIK